MDLWSWDGPSELSQTETREPGTFTHACHGPPAVHTPDSYKKEYSGHEEVIWAAYVPRMHFTKLLQKAMV
jgi:hypothetical protein